MANGALRGWVLVALAGAQAVAGQVVEEVNSMEERGSLRGTAEPVPANPVASYLKSHVYVPHTSSPLPALPCDRAARARPTPAPPLRPTASILALY